MQVRPREQRVVVEHLLEVGDLPVGVDRVAREPAADLVVHAPRGHLAQRVQRHLALSAPEQELDRRRRRELRRGGREAAVLAVIAALQSGHGLVERRRVDLTGVRLEVRGALQAREDPLPGALDLGTLLLPGVGDAGQHLRPGGHAMARLGREVGAGVERHAVGREEGVQRPAPAAGHRLHGVHVDGVDVGPLLAVDLDADEALVHQLRRRAGPRRTRVPSRGTSGRRRSRSTRGSASAPRASGPSPPRPTGTSRRGSPRAAADRAMSRRPVDCSR